MGLFGAYFIYYCWVLFGRTDSFVGIDCGVRGFEIGDDAIDLGAAFEGDSW